MAKSKKVLQLEGIERIIFDESVYHFAINLHLQAYTWAHKWIYDKTVIDAACGTCFGTMIFSTCSKSILGVDKSKKAISYGKERLPFFCPTKFVVKDLNKDELPEADVCVSIETIEHLKPGNTFLKNLKVKELIFTLPIGGVTSEYHLVTYQTPQAFVDYLDECGWQIRENYLGENAMYLGRAIRYE